LDGEFAHGAQKFVRPAAGSAVCGHFIVILHNGNLTKKKPVFPIKNAVSHKKSSSHKKFLKKYLKSLRIYIAKCR